ILEQAPRRPSTVALETSAAPASEGAAMPTAAERAARRGTTARRLRRQLRGDLDTIVGKALEKEPAARYASVGELAADVRRHLRGEPLLARPATARVRVAKFVRRHRTGVAAAAAVVLLAALLTTIYALRLRQERDLAR